MKINQLLIALLALAAAGTAAAQSCRADIWNTGDQLTGRILEATVDSHDDFVDRFASQIGQQLPKLTTETRLAVEKLLTALSSARLETSPGGATLVETERIAIANALTELLAAAGGARVTEIRDVLSALAAAVDDPGLSTEVLQTVQQLLADARTCRIN